MFTNKQLVAYCQQVYDASWVYWYGTCGYKCTESLYASKAKQYPAHYTSDRASGYKADIKAGRMCADCVGMIKSFFWKGGDINGKNVYASNHCPDVSADGMIKLCKESGPIANMPDVPGLVVWKSGHIGVYIGDGYTIEMRGFAYDCVKRKVSAGPWTKWGKLPASMLEYSDMDKPTDAFMALGDRLLRNGSEGDDVRELQRALIELGYSCGSWGVDGGFVDATEIAVKAFQARAGLEEDGVVGPLTVAALEQALDAQEHQQDKKHVGIVGGACYVRTEPHVAKGNILGVVREGDTLDYLGQTSPEGWLSVDYRGKSGWVSGKYGRVIK